MFDTDHGKADTRKTCPEHEDEAECHLQVEQAAETGSEAAVHAFESAAAQPAKREFDDGYNRNNNDQPAQVRVN